MDRTPLHRTPRWVRPAAFVLLGTLAAVALSLVVHVILISGELREPGWRALAAALVLPVIIAAPLLAYIGYTAETVRRCRREHEFAAGYDPSTEVLNGSAFATQVERRRRISVVESGRRFGALLVIEARKMKAINLEYGFPTGQEAMRRVASAIRANTRRSDIVGRLSDSEFGVFLPGATVEQARDVGERIRRAAAGAPFAVEEEAVKLSLDIGGVIFEDQIEFRGLMRVASRQLDLARAPGGDGFRLSAIDVSRNAAGEQD